ncbi:MAG: peptidylprolyl isomerase [Polyangiaceae bacterium]|nr:peptidylprolyl isomerase [Polyangiaceae bacterium]
MRILKLPAALAIVVLSACTSNAPTSTSPQPGTPNANVARAKRDALAPILKKWVTLEAQQGHPKLELSSLAAADKDERRLLSRSISRLASPGARSLTEALLLDEDPEVAGWAAFGLGQNCTGRETAAVGSLTLRVARESKEHARVNPFFADAASDAIARCGGPKAEAVLRSWLETDLSESATRALFRLATANGTLEEPTLVALLGRAPEHPSAILPFARLHIQSSNICRRLIALTRDLVASRDPLKALPAARALGACGGAATAQLQSLLLDQAAGVPARSEALRSLLKVQKAAAPAVILLLEPLAARGAFADLAFLNSPEFGLAKAALAGLSEVPKGKEQLLQTLSQLPLTPGEGKSPSPLDLRKIWLRCQAAELLAHARGTLPNNCAQGHHTDLEALAKLEVLAQRDLDKKAETLLEASLRSEHLTVRERALQVLSRHRDLKATERALIAALTSESSGMITEAAYALTASAGTERTLDEPRPSASPALAKALTSAFSSLDAGASEGRIALIEAAAAYGVLSFVPSLEKLCTSPIFALRTSAERQLRILGDSTRSCTKWQAAPAPAELASLPQAPVTVKLETDQGELRLILDPRVAPLAVARIIRLVEQGAWNGIQVQRVVPGFVVQFGDVDGDGYQGPSLPPLHSELSPVPFGSLEVGMALAGRDTGTNEVFVTLAPAPHLLGDFPWVGRAEGAFSSLIEGDRIQKASILR